MTRISNYLIHSTNAAFPAATTTTFFPQDPLPGTGAKDMQTSSPIGNPDKSPGKPGQASSSTIKRMLSRKRSETASPSPAKPDIEKYAHPYYSRLTMMILKGDFEAAKIYVNTEEGAAEAIKLNKDNSGQVLWAIACGEPEILEEVLWPMLRLAPNKNGLTEGEKEDYLADRVARAQERRTELQERLTEFFTPETCTTPDLLIVRIESLLNALESSSSVTDRVYTIAELDRTIDAWRKVESNAEEEEYLSTKLDYMLYKNACDNRLKSVLALHVLGADPNAPLLDTLASSQATFSPGSTALHAASAHHNPKMIQGLLLLGANPNAHDSNGDTPLHYLVSYEETPNVSCAPYLIGMLKAAGADITLRNEYGRTAMANALFLEHDHIADALAEGGADPMEHERINHLNQSVLYRTIAGSNNDENDDPIALRFLFSKNPKLINARTITGDTALATAIRSGRSNVARFLLTQGARFEDINGERGTALHEIARTGDPAMLAVLMEKMSHSDLGKIINQLDRSGRTALHIAGGTPDRFSFGSWDFKAAPWNDSMIIALTNAGADPDALDARGNSVIAYWLGTNRTECLDLLIDCNASLSSVNDQEDTVLHVIARSPHFDVVRNYIDGRMGGDIVEKQGRKKNKNGQFPDVRYISISEVLDSSLTERVTQQVNKEIQDVKKDLQNIIMNASKLPIAWRRPGR